MALDSLPGETVTKDRDAIHSDWLRSYRVRRPDDDVADNTIPDAEAWIMADQLSPLYANSKRIADNCVDGTKTGAALDNVGYYEGVTRPAAVGSRGYVRVTTAVGGSRIFSGDTLRDPISGLKFYCTIGARYTDQQDVTIAAVDTGPGTNLPAGTVLQWTTPRDGCSTNAIISEQSDGSGLKGGREAANDDEYRELIRQERANRARSGNDADIRKTIKETPNLQVQEVFTIPATRGPATVGITFTMKPARLGGSRRPTEAELRVALDYLRGKMPVDDGQFMMLLLQQLVNLQLQITWASEAEGWVDAAPWPRYSATHAIRVAAAPAPTATTFRLESLSGVYTSTGTPVVGQTSGFHDYENGLYVKKKFLTVTGAGPWDIVVDTTLGGSDPTFVPVAGSHPMPWSPSLDAIGDAIAAYFETLGPGEQQALLWDQGGRQRRYPFSPKSWPSDVNYRMLASLFGLSQLENVVAPVDITTSPTVGTPGVQLYLLEMGEMALYATT